MKEATQIYGIHSVELLVQNNPERVLVLKVLESRQDKKISHIVEIAHKNNIKVESVTRDLLDKMTSTTNHQGIVALCHQQKKFSEADLDALLLRTTKPFLLILDGIQDPHNLGACLRSADAAGVDAVIAPKDHSVGLTPVVTKVASGAVESIPFIQVTNLARTLAQLKEKGIWIFGADEGADQFYNETDLRGSVAIVLGAEGSGLRRLTREHCDGLIKIPMLGTVSSLNVSVATGILLFEVVRQRRSKH